jgi:hypothetical protein
MAMLKSTGINPVPHCLMAYYPAAYITPVYKEQLVLATFVLIDESKLFSPLGITDKSEGGA